MMAFAALTYGPGRASFGAVTPLRSAAPDRRPAHSLHPEKIAAEVRRARALTVQSQTSADPEAAIRKLESIRDGALAPLPRTAEELALAQFAHSRIVQADARMRAAEALERADARQAQQAFQRAMAGEAYSQLEGAGSGAASRLI